MQTVSKIIKKLIIISPYYGLFAVGLNKRFVKGLHTCCVALEGINYFLKIDEDAWKEWSEDVRIGMIWHELLHIVLFHITDFDRWITRCPDKRLLNIAMDQHRSRYTGMCN